MGLKELKGEEGIIPLLAYIFSSLKVPSLTDCLRSDSGCWSSWSLNKSCLILKMFQYYAAHTAWVAAELLCGQRWSLGKEIAWNYPGEFAFQ